MNWTKHLPALMAIAMSCHAWGEELPKGPALAALVAEKCGNGCAVMNASELDALQTRLAELLTEIKTLARREGAESCLMHFEMEHDIPGRKFH